jgi:hypothetical protein
VPRRRFLNVKKMVRITTMLYRLQCSLLARTEPVLRSKIRFLSNFQVKNEPAERNTRYNSTTCGKGTRHAILFLAGEFSPPLLRKIAPRLAARCRLDLPLTTNGDKLVVPKGSFFSPSIFNFDSRTPSYHTCAVRFPQGHA